MDSSQDNNSASLSVDLTGRTLGDFQIIRKLGQGGMGQVYLAEQSSLKRKVALKFLRAELTANPTALTRFRAEAEAVAKINHANIVQVYTVGEYDKQQFMALEYVEGLNLRDYLNRKGPPDVPRALLIMRQVANALQRASETGIVHRDIKPENILLTRKGEVKVTDFGLSRIFGNEQEVNLTQSGMTMGTPLYMSPEQVQGKPVDPRSDIYSFGVTCYHMLAGQPPYRGQNAFEVALKHVNESPPPLAELRPDLPPELCRLVMRMMSKDPAHRPQTGREILKTLNNLRGQTTANPFADLATMRATPAVPTGVVVKPTAPSVETPTRLAGWWWKYAVAAVLAIPVGGLLRFGFGPPRVPKTSVAMPAPTLSEDEAFLADVVERYGNANLTPQNAGEAFKNHVRLITLLLDQRRFAEARAFLDRVENKDPGLQFFRNLYKGILHAFTDNPEKALTEWRLAFDDKNYGAYLKSLATPPSREAVDLRSYLVEAIDRVERTNRLMPEIAAAKREAQSYLKRQVTPPGKKG